MTRKTIRTSTTVLPQEPPSEWLLLPRGELTARWTGGQEATFTVDEAALDSVLTAATRRQRDLSLDYNHAQTDGRPRSDHDMRSAGSFEVELRDDGLWMVGIQWTEDAANYLRRREYRYLSPTFDVDEAGRIVELHNVALTPNPATLGAQPLVASATQPPSRAGEENQLDPIRLDPTLVGLSADTPPAQVAVRVAALVNFEGAVLERLGVTTREAALAAVEQGAAAVQLTETLTARVDELEVAASEAEREQILADARRDGRLTPAQCAEDGWARTVALDVLRSFLASAPRVVPTGQAPGGSLPADKPWAQLTGPERAALYIADRERYLELRRAATGR